MTSRTFVAKPTPGQGVEIRRTGSPARSFGGSGNEQAAGVLGPCFFTQIVVGSCVFGEPRQGGRLRFPVLGELGERSDSLAACAIVRRS